MNATQQKVFEYIKTSGDRGWTHTELWSEGLAPFNTLRRVTQELRKAGHIVALPVAKRGEETRFVSCAIELPLSPAVDTVTEAGQ